MAGKSVGRLEVEASGVYGLPVFFATLKEIASWWNDNDGLLRWATKRCDPDPEVRRSVPEEWDDTY